jgi:hypothetical protein
MSRIVIITLINHCHRSADLFRFVLIFNVGVTLLPRVE